MPLALMSGCNRGDRPGLTGQVAPDFNVSDGTSTIHLANYRGQVVLLNFWASWCVPCVQELPGLLQLHRERPDLAILAVSIDTDPDAYARFIERRHVNLITVRDPEQTAAKLYHTEGWPETYIIDRSGRVVEKIISNVNWMDPQFVAHVRAML